MSSVIDLAAATRMTETAFRLERAKIRDTYGETATDRRGAFDQALAALYAASGWTQEQIASEEHKSRQWVEKRLRFGRFLAIATTVAISKKLTEGRFRGYWERTTGANEWQRFTDVARLMESETTLSKDRSPTLKKHIAEAILAQFADGEWHRFATIVEAVHAEPDDVDAVLFQMRTRGTYHTLCQRRKGGSSWSYRIVRGRGRTIDIDIFLNEVSPIVKALHAEGRKHVARWSPGTIATLAKQLDAVVKRLTHADAPPVGAESDDPHDDRQ